jgi:hypothetical protein
VRNSLGFGEKFPGRVTTVFERSYYGIFGFVSAENHRFCTTMAKERIRMRKIKEILRVGFEQGLSQRKVALCCRLGRSTVQEYFRRFKDYTPAISSSPKTPQSYNISKYNRHQ